MAGPALAEAPPLGGMTPVLHRVLASRRDTVDAVTLTLSSPSPEPSPFAAGQFNMLWAPGIGEVAISISSDPNDVTTIGHTIRDVGVVTHALCALEPGDLVGVRGPFGHGWDLASARGGDVVVVAGGLGLAPLRPAILELLATREGFGRAGIAVGARSPGDFLYSDEVAVWTARRDLAVRVTVDRPGPTWHGDVGVVTEAVRRLPIDWPNATALVCGPEVMIRFAAMRLLDMGTDAGRIRVSLERNMQCGLAQCGHCQLGPYLVCRDGPVLTWEQAGSLLGVRGL